jgi:predicted nucleotidyltransferase
MRRPDQPTSPVKESFVRRFAGIMQERYGADIYVLGSRVRGDADDVESDYDLVAVAAAFAHEPDLFRALDRRRLWAAAGGQGKSLDLHCYTPEEFALEMEALGYLGEAKERGELIKVPVELPEAA